MRLNNKKLNKIFIKYQRAFQEMEHYDRTREKLWGRKKIYLTLNQRVINKLKELRAKRGTPVSRIVENAVVKLHG